jgi:hypothetical protein
MRHRRATAVGGTQIAMGQAGLVRTGAANRTARSTALMLFTIDI